VSPPMTPARAPFALPKLSATARAPSPPDDWRASLGEAGTTIDSAKLDQLRDLVTLLQSANQLMNLTAIKDAAGIWTKLILDALMLTPLLSGLPSGARVADIGCGGGFPGLPLAIACPELQFTLIDATAKKIAFVNHAASELGVSNVSGVVGRAEALCAAVPRQAGALREQFLLVTARAVAPLRVLLELSSPFVRAPGSDGPGGRLALVKGEQAQQELAQARRAIQLLGLVHDETRITPTGRIVVLSKVASTNPRYPRPNGAPKRNPL
jgi:16S rRNA (guanine527-N7)-methyltransferase